MRIVSLIKYRLNIRGLYGWGKGWLSHDYPSRWRDMCLRLKAESSIFEFKEAALKFGEFGACDQFLSDKFSAYMHGMEVVGWTRSSEYCPDEYKTFSANWAKKLGSLAEFIRESFPEVELGMDIAITEYRLDLDEPSVPTIRARV